jgi:hypothetical protein
MRYGKVSQGDWTIEFRFNWRDNQYDVIAYMGQRIASKQGVEGEKIGSVWKDPRKSRRKPSWNAIHMKGQEKKDLDSDFPQMREAGLALLDAHVTRVQL